MYSKKVTKQLQVLTANLLKKQTSGAVSRNEITHLRNILRFHEYRYYILNAPLVSDFEYDQLYKMLQQLEDESPDLITADSPTQRVAKGLTNDFVTVQHLAPMLSLDNSYNSEGLIDFDAKARALTRKETICYCVEPKFDGAGVSLIYENDLLVRGATRGDGAEGDDITTNIRQIKSLPLSAKFSDFGLQQIEIRGEVMINKNNFIKYNEQLMREGLPPFANPRNASAGALRLKNSDEVAKRNLEAFVYHISYFTTLQGKKVAYPLSHHSTCIAMLWQLGFRSPEKEKIIIDGIDGVIRHCLEYEEKRDYFPYEIDGLVIKVDDVKLQDKLGMTSHHPRWAIAYKFKARQATGKIIGIEFHVGRTGAISPVAKLEPVAIGGVTVSSISIHNENYIKEKDLRIGDPVLIERAGDVIPQIVKSLSELRIGNEKEIRFPAYCPVCKSKLFKEIGEAVWRCINSECPTQVVERIIHFTSKNAMDITGFGDATVSKFFEMGFLKNIPGIYQLDYKEIAKVKGFGEKSIEHLKEAVNRSKNRPLHRLIYALGIRFVGTTTAKTLANSLKYLPDFQQCKLEDLQDLEDIGPKVGSSIYHFFRNKGNIKMIQQLEQLGLKMRNDKDELPKWGNLSGLTFLFTGTLPTLKRSDAQIMVEKSGGKVLSGVSKRLNYLVVGEDAGIKLEKAKSIKSIKIISEAAFLKMLGK